jgi:putative ABC transport system substrate-binding protein
MLAPDMAEAKDAIRSVETAGVHHAAWRHDGLANGSARAAIGNAGDRGPQHHVAWRPCAHLGPHSSKAFVKPATREGRNVAIEYRWAQGQYDRLPDLATDLAGRATVIAAHDTPSAIAAKAVTTTIPIVFASGGDPVKLGLVASLNRPGGNVTGVTFLIATLAAKQLGLLHELLPGAERIAVLVDPKFSTTEPFVTEVGTGASAISKRDF